MRIQKLTGTITSVTDLSKTAKEVRIDLPQPLAFEPGSFVNVFMDINGEKVRRAYSIASSNEEQKTIALAIRLTPNGKMTPLFWNTNLAGTPVELMGPLGLNTADKMRRKKVYLFGYGIGAGVVKSLADHFSRQKHIEQLIIMTGSRHEDDILYRDYFDDLAKDSLKIQTFYAVSQPRSRATPEKGQAPHQLASQIGAGYIQDHLSEFDFNNADVYVCGQEAACLSLVEKVKSKNPTDCGFFIEGFH
jgi:NAD(P)H-flavin reductase